MGEDEFGGKGHIHLVQRAGPPQAGQRPRGAQCEIRRAKGVDAKVCADLGQEDDGIRDFDPAGWRW